MTLSEREPQGLSQTPHVSLSEAVQLLAYGKVQSEAELDRAVTTGLREEPETTHPVMCEEAIAALERDGDALDDAGLARLHQLKAWLARFRLEDAAFKAASGKLFAEHVAGRLTLTGFERRPRSEPSPERRPIPPDYFADPRSANWIGSIVQPALDGELTQAQYERLRNDSSWHTVMLRRNDLLVLWHDAGGRALLDGPPDPEPAGSAATARDLPPWLTMPMAVAWVLYRSPDLTLELTSHRALMADAFYPTRTRVGSRTDLQAALMAGRLTARGALTGGTMQDIPPYEWSRIDVDPPDGRPNGPFENIVIAASDLQACFPSTPSAAPEPAPPKPKAVELNDLKAWYDSLDAKERAAMRQVDLLAAARKKFPDNIVARDRVYELTGPRKTGPRRFSG